MKSFYTPPLGKMKISFAFFLVAFLSFSFGFCQTPLAQQLKQGNEFTTLQPQVNLPPHYVAFQDDGSCEQETLGNDVEDGLGNLTLLEFANDLALPEDQNFSLESIQFTVLIDGGATIDEVALHFYEDSGDGPGDEIETSLDLEPSNVEDLGEELGFDHLEVTVDLPEAIDFEGSTDGETIYWIGIQIESMAESAYLEVTSILNTPNQAYFLDPDSMEWISSSDNFGTVYDGVITFSGECSCSDDLVVCEGTPDAGVIDADEEMSICGGTPLNLSVIDRTHACGLSMQWQMKTDEGDWTDIEGANEANLNLIEGIEAETDFRFVITCDESGESDMTETISVGINPADECYCEPESDCSDDDQINLFNLLGDTVDLEYNGDGEDCSSTGYTDLSGDSDTPDFTPGIEYNGSVGTNSPYGENARIWIDYNENGSFEEDETIAMIDNIGSSSSFTFEIPDDITPGTYKVRVRLAYSDGLFVNIPSEIMDPCEAYDYGQTLDFAMEVTALEECDGEITAGEIEEDSFDVCSETPFDLVVTDPTPPAEGLTRVWQSSPAGEDDWSDIEEASTPTYTLEEGIDIPTDFRYSVSCQDNTEYSDVITVGLNPANECYCQPGAGTTGVEPITYVEISDLENSNTTEEQEGYMDFMDMMANLRQGESYEIHLQGSTEGPFENFFTVFIDWNQDGNFDGEEESFVIGSIEDSTGDDGQEAVGTITVPEDANIGTTRMRIYKNYNEAELDPCATNGYGQVHDYGVEVDELSVDSELFQNFRFYPNPVESLLNLQANSIIEQVKVFNLLGQEVLQQNPNTLEAQINTERLESGIYLMKVNIDGVEKSFRIVKK